MFPCASPAILYLSVRRLIIPALLVAGCLAAARASAVTIDFNNYAAVAFSKSSGEYGYAWNWPTRAMAENEALAKCKADDAKIVGWVRGGWLVLFVGGNHHYGVGWQYGAGARLNTATRRALDECKKNSDTVRVVVRLCSGDYKPEVLSFDPPQPVSKITVGE